ncbi:hypothetical protein pdul_cds_172 [Pandoravirus dulcis]|uniref:Uncharacterized protein n=1 Tax=Pandoravirus dulcis TaxID=1349409 RepID=S4VPA7_9VIRU|nr:hypothetical protein pdul_cds_172 [Pandoravirus dulcis]AGO82097.1 hypothetical protein pdul_cds_172 [Pandoravirus dulcis]
MNAKEAKARKPHVVMGPDGTTWHALPDSDEAWAQLTARHAIDTDPYAKLNRLAFCLSNRSLGYERGPVHDLMTNACSWTDNVDKFISSAEYACRSRKNRPTSDMECVRDLTRSVWSDEVIGGEPYNGVPPGIRDAKGQLPQWRPIAPSDPSSVVAVRCGVSLSAKADYTESLREKKRALDSLRMRVDRLALCRATADMPRGTLLGKRIGAHCPNRDTTTEYMDLVRFARDGGLTTEEAFCVASVGTEK